MKRKVEFEADHLRDKARKDLLALLEGVSVVTVIGWSIASITNLYSRFEARRIWLLGKT